MLGEKVSSFDLRLHAIGCIEEIEHIVRNVKERLLKRDYRDEELQKVWKVLDIVVARLDCDIVAEALM